MRVCGYCGVILERKENESNADFLRRRFCSRSHATKKSREQNVLPKESPLLGPGNPPPLPDDHMTPMEYLLRVLNDPTVDQGRKDDLAKFLTPYCHGKSADQGKKQTTMDLAEKAASKFAPRPAPIPLRNQASGGR